MATVTVLKKTPGQVIASFLGTGSGTLELADMATDYEILDAPNAKVNINSIAFTVTGTTTIKRAATNVFVLTEGQETFKLAAEIGCSIQTGNGSNVIVDKGAADGTVILTLSKVAGFTPNVETSIGYDITQKTSIRS